MDQFGDFCKKEFLEVFEKNLISIIEQKNRKPCNQLPPLPANYIPKIRWEFGVKEGEMKHGITDISCLYVNHKQSISIAIM